MKSQGKFADLSEAEQQALLSSVRRINIFSDLQPATVECLEQAELIEADAGDRVLQQGEMADSFWILLDGEMRVEIAGPEGERKTL
ncbi:MAG TPA: cyclic nucleotide-binding domain-containing protein, partial [Acidobacteriaceae bacterium]|nr:cyclic nucleotide-binding domain-containing protein [Acidobacteriaceae bacterium]